MIISVKVLLLLLTIMFNVKSHKTNSIEVSELKTVFTPPQCYATELRYKKHAGLLESSSLTILMVLLALATVLTQ